jgi:hypothetical protein
VEGRGGIHAWSRLWATTTMAEACRGAPHRRVDIACDCTGSEHRDKALWQCMATGACLEGPTAGNLRRGQSDASRHPATLSVHLLPGI